LFVGEIEVRLAMFFVKNGYNIGACNLVFSKDELDLNCLLLIYYCELLYLIYEGQLRVSVHSSLNQLNVLPILLYFHSFSILKYFKNLYFKPNRLQLKP